ncbi:MAG: LysR family transcriptional regulator [Lachnospiraceae bacterium]
MDFRQLQYITTVAQYRNITKAADALFISQSALSHYIQKAEKELGIQLFDRSTTPLTLTLAGEHYIETARRILLENDQLMKVFRDITHHMTGTLRIGTSRERASHMIPRLLPQFSERYPGIEVTILTDSGYKLTEALQRDESISSFFPYMAKSLFPVSRCNHSIRKSLSLSPVKDMFSITSVCPVIRPVWIFAHSKTHHFSCFIPSTEFAMPQMNCLKQATSDRLSKWNSPAMSQVFRWLLPAWVSQSCLTRSFA